MHWSGPDTCASFPLASSPLLKTCLPPNHTSLPRTPPSSPFKISMLPTPETQFMISKYLRWTGSDTWANCTLSKLSSKDLLAYFPVITLCLYLLSHHISNFYYSDFLTPETRVMISNYLLNHRSGPDALNNLSPNKRHSKKETLLTSLSWLSTSSSLYHISSQLALLPAIIRFTTKSALPLS